jgi:hypothetical protein
MISKTSLEKFPDPRVLESLSQRHSTKLFESKVYVKDSLPISSQFEKQMSYSTLRNREKDNEEKSIINSFIVKKESAVEINKAQEDFHQLVKSHLFLKDNTDRNITANFMKENVINIYKKDEEERVEIKNDQSLVQESLKISSKKKLIEKSNIEENNDVNIKISILNINHQKMFENNQEPIIKTPSLKILENEPKSNKKKPEISLKNFEQFDLIENFLVDDLVSEKPFSLITHKLAQPSNPVSKRIPKLDIGSLEEREILKIKAKVKQEELDAMSQPSATPQGSTIPKQLFHAHPLETEKDNLEIIKEPETQLELKKSREEVEEVIYAIRTNIETIVEYSDLLIKIISEEFLSELLNKINNFQADKNKVKRLTLQEYQPGGWNPAFLKEMELSPDYIQEICLNINGLIPEQSKNTSFVLQERKFKENIKIKTNVIEKDLQSTRVNETSNLSKLYIKTISNIDNFATIPSFSNGKSNEKSATLCKNSSFEAHKFKFKNVWDYPAKPYCLLDKKIFLRLTDKILSSYAGANIQENLFDIQKIFHRSIFDAFNESLTEYVFRTRLYNIFLEEIHILKKKKFDLDDLNFFLAKAKFIVIEKASEMVGFLVNKEDSELGIF